jgi:hypothetical protein
MSEQSEPQFQQQPMKVGIQMKMPQVNIAWVVSLQIFENSTPERNAMGHTLTKE